MYKVDSMKLPICNFDAKNSILCPQCERRVEEGELTKADVDASIKLANLAKSNQEIDKFTLYSCKEIDGNFVLSFSKNDIMTIGKAEYSTDYFRISLKEKFG